MKIEVVSKKIILLLTINLLILSGCAVMQKLGGSGSPTDYALGINGATVVASNFTSGHSPFTAINGITSSDGWDDGEGWECRFDRKMPRSGGWSRLQENAPKWRLVTTGPQNDYRFRRRMAGSAIQWAEADQQSNRSHSGFREVSRVSIWN